MEFNKKLFRSDIITKRMIDNRLTFDEVSKQSGVSASTLCRLERGTVPDMDTFVKICRWLGKLNPSVYFHSEVKRGK